MSYSRTCPVQFIEAYFQSSTCRPTIVVDSVHNSAMYWFLKLCTLFLKNTRSRSNQIIDQVNSLSWKSLNPSLISISFKENMSSALIVQNLVFCRIRAVSPYLLNECTLQNRHNRRSASRLFQTNF